ELRHSIGHIIRTVGQRESIKEGLQGRFSILPRSEVRHVSKQGLWQPEPQTFIGEEEKSPIFQDRPAERPPEIVLSLFWFWFTCVVGEPVVRVEHIVAQVIEQGPVKPIRARASDD